MGCFHLELPLPLLPCAIGHVNHTLQRTLN
uniref:Uncharacterized protein n=1 Tax=Anguilla anguilla TaxID=7936 RepID=A0A0E9V176_ANGAN